MKDLFGCLGVWSWIVVRAVISAWIAHLFYNYARSYYGDWPALTYLQIFYVWVFAWVAFTLLTLAQMGVKYVLEKAQ